MSAMDQTRRLADGRYDVLDGVRRQIAKRAQRKKMERDTELDEISDMVDRLQKEHGTTEQKTREQYDLKSKLISRSMIADESKMLANRQSELDRMEEKLLNSLDNMSSSIVRTTTESQNLTAMKTPGGKQSVGSRGSKAEAKSPAIKEIVTPYGHRPSD